MMKKTKTILILLLVVGVAFLALSLTVMETKKPKLKGTKWQCVEEMFVADAGTMTITHTIEFTTNKDAIKRYASYLPAHPAMYMNSDGTVDKIPARSSEYTDTCTYEVKARGKNIILKEKDGKETVYEYEDDKLVTQSLLTNEKMVFNLMDSLYE